MQVETFCFCFAALEDERLSAEEMDEKRKQNMAYEYLCHLEEAKKCVFYFIFFFIQVGKLVF